jgi:hypothetical protein
MARFGGAPTLLASTQAGCIVRTKGANAAIGTKKRVLKNVIIDQPLER